MSGFKIKLPIAVSDTTMKKLYNDEIMSSGSLFLFDPSHSLGYSGTELANAGVAKNIAWETANKILGSGDANTLSGTISTTNITPTTAILELTTKKGLHGVISKVNGANNTGWKMTPPLPIRNYIIDSWYTKKLYVSVWGRVTRISDTNTSAFLLISSNISATSNYKSLFEVGKNNPDTGVNLLGNRISGNTIGNFIRTSGVNGAVGTNAILDSNSANYIKIGNVASPYGGFEAGKSNSMIIYRYYMEDLDVSGRTYAEVDAIDKAMYDAAFAVGGKYYGDTFTDPATLP